jgi:regulatory protein
LRTEGEIREKLRIKNYEAGITDKVIEQLKENHYLNDENYAQVYLDNLKKYKTFGYYGIKKKLMEKRLPSNIIESVLSEGLGEEEEAKIANRLLKKLDEADKQKLAQKLKAKGFRMGVISKLVF